MRCATIRPPRLDGQSLARTVEHRRCPNFLWVSAAAPIRRRVASWRRHAGTGAAGWQIQSPRAGRPTAQRTTTRSTRAASSARQDPRDTGSSTPPCSSTGPATGSPCSAPETAPPQCTPSWRAGRRRKGSLSYLRAVGGEPSSCCTVLQDLATLGYNITHTQLNPEAKIVTTTWPTPLQAKAFRLLGLNPACTQSPHPWRTKSSSRASTYGSVAVKVRSNPPWPALRSRLARPCTARPARWTAPGRLR